MREDKEQMLEILRSWCRQTRARRSTISGTAEPDGMIKMPAGYKLRIVIDDNHAAATLAAALKTPAGERAMINWLRANPGVVRAAISAGPPADTGWGQR
jgi:hypothetical protein